MKILLTDEEINKLYKDTNNKDNFYRRSRTQRGYDREIAKAQLKKVVGVIQSKFKREVIPSGSQAYPDDVVLFLRRLNSAYYMITKEDWQALLKEVEE